MKRKLLLVLKIVLSVSINSSFAYYLIDIFLIHSSPFKHLFIPLIFGILPATLLILLVVLKRKAILKNAKRKFSSEISDAFDTDKRKLNKLLFSTYQYSVGKNNKSLRMLNRLKKACAKKSEHIVVALFRALNYTSLQKSTMAISVYDELIKDGYGTSPIFNNIGHLYSIVGDNKKAHENYDIAIRMDKTNITAYHNKAQLCFKEYEYKKAIELSNKALELNPKFSPSTTLLAIIYALTGTSEEAIKAKGNAIENGEKAYSIDRAVNYYRKNLT